MRRIRRIQVQLRRRWAHTPPRRRLVGALAALGLAVGLVWLAAWRGDDAVSLSSSPMPAAQLAACQQSLAARGIPFSLQGGRIMVAQVDMARARQAVASAGDAGADLRRLAQEDDLWSTSEQKARRWQAARMGVLSRLIASFDAVAEATVLIEPGSPRGLGSPAVAPTASVNVTLRPGRRMTGELVTAIADQVAASVAGMGRQDVRIVDSAGRSYRAVEDDPAAVREFQQLQAAEDYYRRRVLSALAHVDAPSVGVTLARSGDELHCAGAWVSLPHDYLLAGQPPGGADDLNDRLNKALALQAGRLRQAVMSATGCTDAAAIELDWHYRSQAAPLPVAAAGWTLGGLSPAAMAGAVGSLAFLVLAARLVLRRRSSESSRGEPAEQQLQEPGDAGGEEPDEAPLAFLQDLPAGQMVELLTGEHPQTVAVVLAHLGGEASAAVLSAMPPDRQVEVVTRVAEMGEVDPEIVHEVRRCLLERLGSGDEDGEVGGVARIAEILHHAGYATETSVLAALADRQPALADSIRQRMFVFDDISDLPPGHLASALEDLGSEDLAVALRTAGGAVRKGVLSALSKAKAREVREEMEALGPVRLSDVEAAQQRVMEAIRRSERGRYVAHSAERASGAATERAWQG